MSSPQHTQALDQLQRELNRTLENIGHLFKAANNGSRSATAARASQLKGSLPKSIDSFHDALDRLEDDLQLAKAVMRRDLAICREQSGQQVPAQGAQQVPSISAVDPVVESNEDAKALEPHPKPDEPEEESVVQMQESEPAAPQMDSKPAPGTKVEDTKAGITQTTESTETEDVKATGVDAPAIVSSEKDAVPNDADTDSKPPDPVLKVDTSAERPHQPTEGPSDPAHNEKKPLDTAATMSEGQDLESLFNDPVSAGGGVSTGGNNTDNTDPADFTSGFDFDPFSASLDNSNNNTIDNDSISALLPGLQDYANTQPAGTEAEDPDFNALFATDAPMGGAGNESQQASEGEQRDTTFDDIMNFEFTGGEYTGGGEGGTNNDQDFDFNFD